MESRMMVRNSQSSIELTNRWSESLLKRRVGFVHSELNPLFMVLVGVELNSMSVRREKIWMRV